MNMATANFSDLVKAAQDAGYGNCPPGTYDVTVVKGEAKVTSGGKDMIVVQYQITSGPNSGRKVNNNFVISPENANALGFFFRHMAAMGLDTDYFTQDPAPAQVAAALVGKSCRIEVGTRTWNGEEREDVKKVMAPLAGQPSGPVSATPAASPASTAADPMAPKLPF